MVSSNVFVNNGIKTTKETHIKKILQAAAECGVSDVHIKAGFAPAFRIRKKIQVQQHLPVCTADDIEGFLQDITSQAQRNTFYRNMNFDFGYNAEGIARFRVNACYQLSTISLVLRLVATNIPSINELGLPKVCEDLVMKKDGLLILTGPTGCGKSTTMAAMLNFLNNQQERKVVTIEDPIEYLFQDNKCTFTQREVNIDTKSFANGLKHVLRQDPDVILLGEMRDMETMSAALTAAETGHLVLATLHTPSSYQAIDRFVDAFPAVQQPQVRMQLSTVLQAIVYQNLIPSADGKRVYPAVEVLVAIPAIRNIIRDGKTFMIANYIQSGQSMGMQTLDQSLNELYRHRLINRREAVNHAQNPESIDK